MVKRAWGISSCRRFSSPDESTASPMRVAVMKRMGKPEPAMTGSYIPMLSPLSFGLVAPMTDSAASAARLSRRALVRVEGPDWRSYLQGLVSQDVSGLSEGEVRYGALLTPQGRLQFELFLHGRAEGVTLETAAERRDALVQKLRLHRLRAKVDVEAEDGSVFALFGDAASRSPGWAVDPRLALAGFRAIGREPPAADGAVSADAAAYDAFRLRLGLYDGAVDPGEDRAYLTELNFDLLHGVDYKKGCFVGQETTSRMKRRGGVRSRAITVEVEGDPGSGEDVLAGDLRAGEVLTASGGRALCVLRLDRALGGGLTIGGAPARLAPAPWLVHALEPASP